MRYISILLVTMFIAPAFADPEFDDFIAAIRRDDTEWVEEFLSRFMTYPKLNFDEETQIRPILEATSTRMKMALINFGATAGGTFQDLFEAIDADDVERVRFILRTSSIKINDDSLENCRRLFMYAHSPEMLMLLIEKGALLTKSSESKDPFVDDCGHNALHVLAENAARWRKKHGGDERDTIRRIEATALFLIRLDAPLNDGNLILHQRNTVPFDPDGEIVLHLQPCDCFIGPFWSAEFVERLRNYQLPRPPVVRAPPRVFVPVLRIMPLTEGELGLAEYEIERPGNPDPFDDDSN